MFRVYGRDIYEVTKSGKKLRANRDAAPAVFTQSDLVR